MTDDKTVNEITETDDTTKQELVTPGNLPEGINRPKPRDRSNVKMSLSDAKRKAHDPARRHQVEPSPKQVRTLLEAGYSTKDIAQLTLASAEIEIDYAIKSGLLPVTDGQRAGLIKWGYSSAEIADWDSGMASEFFDDATRKADIRTNGNYSRKRKAG